MRVLNLNGLCADVCLSHRVRTAESTPNWDSGPQETCRRHTPHDCVDNNSPFGASARTRAIHKVGSQPHSACQHAARWPAPGIARRLFYAAQQLAPDPITPYFRHHFDCLDVRCWRFPTQLQIHDCETRHASVFFRNPCLGMCVARQRAHHRIAEPERRLKASLLDQIKLRKIAGLIGAIAQDAARF